MHIIILASQTENLAEQQMKSVDRHAKHPSPGEVEKDHNDFTAEDDPYIGPFVPNAANNAPVWAIYGAQAKISDQQIFKICNNDLDSLLIFVSKLSSHRTPFIP